MPKNLSEPLFHEKSIVDGKAETEKTTISSDMKPHSSKPKKYDQLNTHKEFSTESTPIATPRTNEGKMRVIAKKSKKFRTVAVGRKSTKNLKRTNREIRDYPDFSAYKSMFNEKSMISVARALGLLVVQVVVVPPVIG